jgi:hypothetical protein
MSAAKEPNAVERHLAYVAAHPEELIDLDENGEPYEDAWLLAPSKRGRIGAWFVPGTEKTMFVSKTTASDGPFRGAPGWVFGHTSSATGITKLILVEKAEAFKAAKAFYDAALAECIPISGADKPDIVAWWAAIKKHVPSFALAGDRP